MKQSYKVRIKKENASINPGSLGILTIDKGVNVYYIYRHSLILLCRILLTHNSSHSRLIRK